MASIIRPFTTTVRTRCACAPAYLRIPARSFHASPSAMKKSRSKSIVEEEEFEDEDAETTIEEEDLFASSSTPIIRDPSEHLQPLLTSLDQMIALPTTERHSAFSQTRVGVLRRIVQLYPGEEIDGLKKVLRNWRFLGGRVTRKTAEEIVGRCCRLNRADLAVELVNDRTQYGLPPLPTHVQSLLLQNLLQSPTPVPISSTATIGIPISKTLATLRLALMQKTKQEPLSSHELTKLVGQVKKVKIEAKEAEAWRIKGKGMLESAGGMWADAAKRLEAVAV